MKIAVLLIAFWWSAIASAQTTFSILPVFKDKQLLLNQAIVYGNDTLQITQLKWYIQHVAFFSEDSLLCSSTNEAFLMDLADTSTLHFSIPGCGDSPLSHLNFQLGIDSVTNLSGALGGDLDPMFGMYWTWQSGYIHFKIEGINRSTGITFSYHIGGYAAPFKAYQHIELPLDKNGCIFDIEPILRSAFVENRFSILSPSISAQQLAQIAAQSFRKK